MGRAKGGNAAVAGVTGNGARRGTTRMGATTVVMTVGELMVADTPGGVAGVAGLENVAEVQKLPNGLYRVTMHDGSTAIVNLQTMEVAHSSGDAAAESEQLGALAAAMGHQAMYDTDPATTDPNAPDNATLLALGDAYAELKESDEEPSAEQLAAVVEAARDHLDAAGIENVTLNPETLTRMLAPEKPMSDRAKMRQAMATARQNILAVQANGELSDDEKRMAVAHTLMFPVDPATGEPVGAPTKEMQEDFAAAADKLGLKVPELKIAYDENGYSVGDFEIGANEKERIDIIRNALAYGDRTFAFRGPPGSGKGEMTQQLAAIMGMGYLPINAGSTMDIEMLAGSDGLARADVEVEVPRKTGDGKFIGMVKEGKSFVEKPVDQETDADGKPLFDEDTGFPVLKDGAMPATERQTQSLTVSKAMLGQLAMGVQGPYVVEIQEPERMQEGFVRFHSALGEKFGQPDKRYLTLNVSSAVDSGDLIIDGVEKGKKFLNIPVHPEAIIAMTYNPGIDDIKFKQATHDRMVNLDFDYPTKEAECRRLAKMVNAVFTDDSKDIPEGLRREWDPDVFEPIISMGEKLRNAAKENPAFIEEPGARTLARFASNLFLQAYQGDNRGDRTARLLLDYLRSYEEKGTTAPDSLVNSILADEVPALQKLADGLYEEGAKARGEKQ